VPRNTSGLKRGGPGRKKGSKDVVPQSFKASIKAVYEDLLTNDPELVKSAVLRGLQARKPKEAFLYVRLFADLSGELKQQLEHTVDIVDHNAARQSLSSRIAGLAARLGTGDVAQKPS
jgi:hypothetical protein